MAKNSDNSIKEKRPYSKTAIKEAIEAGKDWRFNIVLDNDVAKKVLAEKLKSPLGKTEYYVIVNNRLRKGYGLKQK